MVSNDLDQQECRHRDSLSPSSFFPSNFKYKKKFSVYLLSLESLSLSALLSQFVSAANTSTTLGLAWAELLSRLSNIHRIGPQKVRHQEGHSMVVHKKGPHYDFTSSLKSLFLNPYKDIP